LLHAQADFTALWLSKAPTIFLNLGMSRNMPDLIRIPKRADVPAQGTMASSGRSVGSSSSLEEVKSNGADASLDRVVSFGDVGSLQASRESSFKRSGSFRKQISRQPSFHYDCGFSHREIVREKVSEDIIAYTR